MLAVVLGMGLFRFSYTVADPDLWGHVKFGQTIWESGRIVLPDPFSYLTQEAPWVNHEWLPEVIFYVLFQAAGALGLVSFKLGVALTVFGLTYGHLTRQGLTPVRAAIIVLAMMHFFLPFFITVRPLIVTYLFFLAALFLLEDMTRGRARWLWGAPPLFALWANLHPGFLAGLGILFIWSGVELGRRWVRSRRGEGVRGIGAWTILAAAASCGLATALTPHGISLWPFLYRTATGSRPDITEWQPLALMTPLGLGYFFFAALAALGVVCSRRARHPALLAVLACSAVLPLIAIRHTPLAALALSVLAGGHMSDAWERWRGGPAAADPRGSLRAVGVLGSLLLLGAVLLGPGAVRNLGCIRIDPPVGMGYPVRAIALLKESGVVGNLAIDFDWGLYAIYHLAPRIKVSLDGRRETGYPPALYAENLQFMFGQGDWDALLRRPETHLALVKTGLPAFNLMKLSPGWSLVYSDPLAGLFAREATPRARQLQRSSPPSLPHDGAGLCFP